MGKFQIPNSKFQILAILALCFFCLTTTHATEDFPKSFDAANQLYEQGKFSDAAAAYETLIQSNQVSPALYFNLGNARFKAAQLGRAIAAYRQAEQLAPRDPDIRANLQFARNQVKAPTQPPGRWERALGKLTVNEWTLLTTTSFWLCLLTLALRQLRPAWKASLQNVALTSGLATVVLGVCLASVSASSAQPTAILTAHGIPVRSGPLTESPTLFSAHDGAELTILDTKDDWLQVSVGQRTGWLQREQVQMFP